MADKNLLELELDAEALNKFLKKFKKNTAEHVENFLARTRLEWRREFLRQQASNGDGQWPRLGITKFIDGKKIPGYADRKKREYESGKIRFNSLLKRNGTLMNGYISGITIGQLDKKLTINYPLGIDQQGYNTRIRAKSHQGAINRPKGVPIRAFDTQKFYDIATNLFFEELGIKP